MNKNRRIGVFCELKVNIGVAFCLLIVASIIFVLFIKYEEYRELIKFLTSLIGGATIIYAAYYAATTLKSNIARDKQRVSNEACKLFTDLSMIELRMFIDNEIKKITPIDLYNKIESNKELLSKVHAMLGFFEDLSISIQEEYADEIILKKSLNYVSCYLFENLNQYVIDVRKQHNRPTLYIEYEKLFNAWKNDKSLLTGKQLSIN